MSTSILDALRNAEINIRNSRRVPPVLELAEIQLHNAVCFLEKGYSLDDDISELLEKYPEPECAPDKETA